MEPSTIKHYRTCPLCEALCGLEIDVQNEKVTRIAGDFADVFSQGFLCPKGASLQALHDDPDRLREPLIRRGERIEDAVWEQVSWQEAFDEVERRLVPVIARHGRDAVALYLGNPNVHNLSGAFYIKPLVKALGTRNLFSASTVDQMPKHVACGFMFGDPGAIPVPDLDRTQWLLMLGANPWESNGSLCSAPDFPGRLKALRARGGRLIVVDPRRTRTAEHADEHIRIRPGTDAHLLMAMIHVLFEQSLINLGPAAPWVNGLSELERLAQPYLPDGVAEITAVPAEAIRRLARELASTERAVVYGRLGTHTTEFGTLAAWAVDVLNVLTGHLDVPGGAMWPLPAHARPRASGPGRGFVTGRYRSRVKGYPEVRGEFPVATLADEIEAPGQGQVRALLTVAGNPALSTPDSKRLERALSTLACMISVDPYRNETTRYAHVILPPPSPLHKSQYDLAFSELAVRNVAKWSAPVFSRSGPSECDILAKLALIAAGRGAGADPGLIHEAIERGLLERACLDSPKLAEHGLQALREQLRAREPADRAVEILVRTGHYGDQFGAAPEGLDFARLSAHPHGIDLGPLVPRLPQRIQTPSGKIELAPPPITKDLARLTQALAAGRSTGLVLVGRRDLRSNNSWMHNLPSLVKGPERCVLQMHPQDARRRGIEDGQQVKVESARGSLIVRVQVSDVVMQGVVSLPHGWGHDAPGSQLSVARQRAGVNSNILTDSAQLDPLSGTAALNGVAVTVAPAADPS